MEFCVWFELVEIDCGTCDPLTMPQTWDDRHDLISGLAPVFEASARPHDGETQTQRLGISDTSIVCLRHALFWIFYYYDFMETSGVLGYDTGPQGASPFSAK